jgi:hypothetical protein
METLFEPEEPARVTILTPAATDDPLPARIIALFGKRMTLSSDVAASLGSALKVESARYIFMGKAVDVRQNGIVLLHIHHALKRDDVNLLQSHWV